MALFSRGKRNRDQSADSEQPADPTPTPEPEQPAGGPDGPASQAASVPISVTSFRGVGAAEPGNEAQAAPDAMPAPQPSLQLGRELAPPSREVVPGLRDNALLAEALGGLGADPTPQQILEVARQLLQGNLYLRVKGDARTLLAEGKGLPLAIVTLGEENFVVAYSGGAALGASIRADGASDTSAMGQPASTVLRHVLAGPYAGLVIDPASAPARAVLRRDMLERMMESADPSLELKNLVVGERDAATPGAVAEALSRTRFWVAVSRVGDAGAFGVAELRTAEGERLLEIFSHPLEIVALGRGEQPAPMTGEQLGRALRADPQLSGVLVDAAGPWIRVTREDLGILIDV